MTDNQKSPEEVAYLLTTLIIQKNENDKYGKEEILSLYGDCLKTIKNPNENKKREPNAASSTLIQKLA